MAWTSPATAVAGTALTAAMWNATVRDNLNTTLAAVATGATGTFSSTAANALVQRVPSVANVLTSETTTSTLYADLTTPGPSVTVTTGTGALVILMATIATNTVGGIGSATYTVSGATAFTSTWAILNFRSVNPAGNADQIAMAGIDFIPTLTPGSNTFKMLYASSSGTVTVTFVNRKIIVWPL